MKLTWQEYLDPIFGKAFELQGLRDGESGSCRANGGKRKNYVAMAFIGGSFMWHCGRTMDSAMARLNKEIDRRSLGLFRVDDVTFATARR